MQGYRSDRLLIAAVLLLAASLPLWGDQVNPEILLSRVGEVRIDSERNYAEVTRVRIEVRFPPGHALAGERMKGFNDFVRVEEWTTDIYNGRDGASKLPRSVLLEQGLAEFELYSVASFRLFNQRKAPIPGIVVYARASEAQLSIPQWVDVDGNDKTDWFEARVEGLIRRIQASPIAEVDEVSAVYKRWKQSYKQDCGGFDPEQQEVMNLSPVCLDWTGDNAHRLNLKQQLAATILHEMRHLWIHHRPEESEFKQGLINAPSGVLPLVSCDYDRLRPAEMCATHIRDERYAAQELDAEAFAERYRRLFP